MLPGSFIVNFDVLEVGVCAKTGVHGEGPWCGCPGEQTCVRVLNQREGNNHSRVLHILVVLRGLEVAEWCGQGSAVRHDLEPAVDCVLLEQPLEHPPLRLHEAGVHGLVVVVEVDPATKPVDRVPPLGRISHDDGSALLVVLGDTNFPYGVATRHAELLVNLVLDGHTVGIPAKTALDITSVHGPVSWDDILNGGGQEMAIMGHARRKRRSIVEGVRLFAFRLSWLCQSFLFSAHPDGCTRQAKLLHTSSICVRKALISSQRLRMRSSSLGKSIDMAERGVVE